MDKSLEKNSHTFAVWILKWFIQSKKKGNKSAELFRREKVHNCRNNIPNIDENGRFNETGI